MVALAMFAAACANVEEPVNPQNPSGDNIIVFEANVPTKTATVDDKNVTWVAGDEVKFAWTGGEAVSTASKDGATTTFSVQLAEEVEEAYVVYPSAVCAGVEDGKVVLDFTQALNDGQFSKADICVAKAVKTDGVWNTTLNFKNSACLLKVGVTSEETCRIQVVAVGDEIIGGNLTVSLDGDNISFEYPEEGKTMMTMPVSAPGNYYIPVFPGVELSDGFRVNCFVPGEGEEAEPTQVTPFYYNGTFTTERGKIIILSEIESRLGQYYVTPVGAGAKTGHNWSNAMDVEAFKAFATNQDNHFLLKGSTFHFSADEFSFGDSYVVFSYSDHSTVDFTLEGTVSGENMTVFKGRSAGENSGVFWPQANTDLTVKNVKFTGTDGKSNYGAVRINNGAKKVTFDNCVFEGNKTSGNAAAINLLSGAEMLIKDCTFIGNAGVGGNVIHVNNTSAKVRIENTVLKEASAQKTNYIKVTAAEKFELIDSEISDNYTYASIYTTSGFTGTFYAEGTVWKNNHAYDDYGPAGWYESAATYKFVDCEFLDNMADWGGGALIFVGAHAIIEGCTFQGNHADGVDDSAAAGGAIYAKGEGVVVDCKDCTFKENYNFVGNNFKSGGIIRVEQSGGKARFDNCVFDGNFTNRNAQDNAASAAIINCRKGGAIYYFNACEFKNNTSGQENGWDDQQGGTKGTVIASYASSTIAMNNCSMHDNYGARNSDDLSWIYVDNTSNTLVISNSTIVGDPTRCNGTRKNDWGVIKLHSTGNYHLINNILCSLVKGGQTVWCGKEVAKGTSVNSYYNKTNPELDGRIDWGTDTGSGHDYYASSECFGGWTLPYTWNGTLIGANSDKLATTTNVNSEIQSANSDFYNWLSSIGALGKDINGKDRGTTSWPGCYQN